MALRHDPDCRLHDQPRLGQGRKPRAVLGRRKQRRSPVAVLDSRGRPTPAPGFAGPFQATSNWEITVSTMTENGTTTIDEVTQRIQGLEQAQAVQAAAQAGAEATQAATMAGAQATQAAA